MIEKFTPRAKKVMEYAEQEALQMKHGFISSEHVLLGLAKESTGVACHVLRSYSLCYSNLSMFINDLVKHGEELNVNGKLPYTPEVKRIIEVAYDYARDWGDSYVGTEHLLMSVLDEKNDGTVASIVLKEKREIMRQEVLRTLGHDVTEPNTCEIRSCHTCEKESFCKASEVMVEFVKLAAPMIKDNADEAIADVAQLLAKRCKYYEKRLS